MNHRLAIAAVAATAALIVGACADRDGASRLSTEPESASPAVRYVSVGTAAYVNRATHQLQQLAAPNAPPGVSASIVGGSGGGTAVQIAPDAPGVAKTGGKGMQSFVDDANHRHTLVFLYRSAGGPPAAMQHYVDGALVSTSAFQWLRTSTGWVRTRSVLQVVSKGALVGSYTTVTVPATGTTPTKPGSGGGPIQTVRLDRAPGVGPLQRVAGALGYGLAFAFAPQDANAQLSLYPCRQEWLHYVGAAALLSAAAVAMASAPELSPAMIGAFVAALTTTAGYEDLLLDCVLGHMSMQYGSFGGAGGGASLPTDKWDCFDGSYSAHCTTAFTI